MIHPAFRALGRAVLVPRVVGNAPKSLTRPGAGGRSPGGLNRRMKIREKDRLLRERFQHSATFSLNFTVYFHNFNQSPWHMSP